MAFPFLQVIENEVYFNNIYYALNRRTFYREVFVHPIIQNKIQSITIKKLVVILILVFSPVVLFPSLLKSIYKYFRAKHFTITEQRVFLYNTITLSRVARFAYPNESDGWILTKYIKDIDGIHGKVYSEYNIINLFEIFKAFLMGIGTSYKSLIIYGPSYAYLAISSYQWYVYLFAVSHIPKSSEIICCNHKDAYAILIDSLPHTNKTLIQHGTEIYRGKVITSNNMLFSYIQEYDIWTQNVPNKWKTLGKLLSFSPKEAVALIQAAIASSPDVIYVDNSLKLEPKIDFRKVLLIIGRFSLYRAIEEEIISSVQDKNIRVIVKNHPHESKSCYLYLQKVYNFDVINGDVYPTADLVVGYNSTLMTQYQDAGIEVMYYEELNFPKIMSILND